MGSARMFCGVPRDGEAPGFLARSAAQGSRGRSLCGVRGGGGFWGPAGWAASVRTQDTPVSASGLCAWASVPVSLSFCYGPLRGSSGRCRLLRTEEQARAAPGCSAGVPGTDRHPASAPGPRRRGPGDAASSGFGGAGGGGLRGGRPL